MTRPPERLSSVQRSSSRRSGWHRVTTMMLVASRIRVVRPAALASTSSRLGAQPICSGNDARWCGRRESRAVPPAAAAGPSPGRSPGDSSARPLHHEAVHQREFRGDPSSVASDQTIMAEGAGRGKTAACASNAKSGCAGARGRFSGAQTGLSVGRTSLSPSRPPTGLSLWVVGRGRGRSGQQIRRLNPSNCGSTGTRRPTARALVREAMATMRRIVQHVRCRALGRGDGGWLATQ